MKIKKSILVYDNCEFTFIAAYFAQYFEKVYYYSRWESGFPYYGAKNIGTGIDNIERVNEPESIEDDVDIFYFTDIYFMGTANRLRKEGRKVWGSGDMEMIERNRHTFHDLLIEAGLPTPPTVFIKGFDKLLEYLKGKKNLWVKLSEYRGSGETFKWIDDNWNEFFVNEWKRQLGVGIRDKGVEFLVQEEIETELEWGVDTYMVNSEFPENMFMGFEQKGESYYTKLVNVKDLPKEWQEVLEKFSNAVKKYKYTGTFSMEVRIGKDGKQYFIDPTVRQPFPATASIMYLTENYGDIILNALYEEKTTKVKSKDKYGAEIIMRTSVTNNWIPAYVDKKFQDKVYFVDNIIEDGTSLRVPPEQLYCDSMKYCSALGSGDTLEEAIKDATETADEVKSKGLEWSNTMLESSKIIIPQLKELGYKF